MNQALEQPGTLSGKRHQHRLFTKEELLEQIFDSEEDEREFDEEYPFSSESDESFRSVMSRDRFLSLWSFLHIIDNEDKALDKSDRIYKIMALNQIAACFLNVSNASSGEGFDNQLAGTFLL
ncbi:hypothetical protein RRG08_028246 [Elysia crispata]|uniref:Uncharacterized protein n=1 Tax=Elysia crispata TaxID=231223 RepID=A0AAE0YEM4_9GAST|nr:hypothetical protein RRG08_028246 [Elysia crispata]